MLTPILKTQTLAGLTLAYVLCGLMLAFGLVFQTPEPVGAEMLYSHWAFSWLQTFPNLTSWLCLGLVSAVGVLSRLRPGETKIAYSKANMTMLILVCIVVTQFETVFSKPNVLASGAISLAMFWLIHSTYKKENVLPELFHIGLLLGLSSLFVGQTILLILPVAFSLSILRTGNWKEWTVLFLGLAMCTVFLMMVAIWSDFPLVEFRRIIQSAWGGFFSEARVNPGHFVLLGVLALAASSLFRSLTVGTVTERNLILVNLAWFVANLLMVVLLGLGWQEGLILAAFPLSVSAAKSIESIQRWWLADLILVLVLSAPFIRNLWQF